jgi:putative peptidoglycan lipid II flippase
MVQLKSDLKDGLLTVGLISILSGVALIVLAYPVSRVFVGEHDANLALGNVLMAFMLGLLPFSLGFFMQKAFYSLEDTRTPFWITVVQSAIYIAGAIVIQLTSTPEFRVSSLALLTSGCVTVQAALGYLLLKRRIGTFGIGLFASMLRFGIAALLGGGLGWVVLQWLGGSAKTSFALSSVLASVLSSVIVGLVILVGFVISLWAFRSPEFALLRNVATPVLKRVRGIIGR